MSSTPTVDVVVLTQGTRPVETAAALDSVRAQEGVEVRLLLVGNGWEPVGYPEDVTVLTLPKNVGPPRARNLATEHGSGEYIFFLDDDGWLDDPTALARAVAQMAADPALGLVHPRLSDPHGVTQRRWVPRAHVGDPRAGGPAFAVCEGAVIVRRTAWEDAGGYPGRFFFGGEGVELAWRLRDAGWDLTYDPSIIVRHPATLASRHATFYRLSARNRAWVARRNLPWPVATVYLFTWIAITVLRTWRDPKSLRVWFSGLGEGLRTDPGRRRRMRWATVLQLTLLGQPPII